MKTRRTLLIFFIFFALGASQYFHVFAQTQNNKDFPQNLTLGSTGADVASLQAFLMSQGFLDVSGPTGYFGSLTATAVARWQSAVGLPDTGYFGAMSRSAIADNAPIIAKAKPRSTATPTVTSLAANSGTSTDAASYNRNLSIGSTGSDVSTLQSFLIKDGFLTINTPTEFYGNLTSAAVAKWQGSIGLPSTGFFGTMSRAEIDAPTIAQSSPTQSSGVALSTPAQTISPTIPATIPAEATTTPYPITYGSGGGGGGGGGGNSGGGANPVVVSTPTPTSTPAATSTPADTTPPTISITSPATSSTVIGSTTVNVSASDDVGVTRVEFYIDGDLKASSTASPYNFSFNTNTLSAGVHILTAKAYDAAGNVAAGTINVIVALPVPSKPTGLTITGNASSTISLSWATSTETGGVIAGYNIYRDSTQIGTSSMTSFTNSDLSASTTYSFNVASYDASGTVSATSTSVTTTTLSLPATPSSSVSYDFGLSLGESPVYLSSSSLDKEMDAIASLGVGMIRFDMQWEHVQPTNSSTYNWSLIDPVVAAAAARHIKVLAILDFTPSWAASSSCTAGNSHCAPADPDAFANFAAAAAARYAPEGVTDWEIWNEPNITSFWGPTTDCSAYTDLLKAAYPAIKTADPNATVITAGLSPASTDGNNMSPPNFLSCIYADGGRSYFDAVGDHPYTYPYFPTVNNGDAWDEMASGTDSLRGIMVANGDSNKKIWITEFGAPTDGPDPHWYVTEAQQSTMLTDAYNLFSSYSWAGPFFWYTYQDGGTSTSTNENFFGLFRADGSTKPAYTTLQNLIAPTL